MDNKVTFIVHAATSKHIYLVSHVQLDIPTDLRVPKCWMLLPNTRPYMGWKTISGTGFLKKIVIIGGDFGYLYEISLNV